MSVVSFSAAVDGAGVDGVTAVLGRRTVDWNSERRRLQLRHHPPWDSLPRRTVPLRRRRRTNPAKEWVVSHHWNPQLLCLNVQFPIQVSFSQSHCYNWFSKFIQTVLLTLTLTTTFKLDLRDQIAYLSSFHSKVIIRTDTCCWAWAPHCVSIGQLSLSSLIEYLPGLIGWKNVYLCQVAWQIPYVWFHIACEFVPVAVRYVCELLFSV